MTVLNRLRISTQQDATVAFASDAIGDTVDLLDLLIIAIGLNALCDVWLP